MSANLVQNIFRSIEDEIWLYSNDSEGVYAYNSYLSKFRLAKSLGWYKIPKKKRDAFLKNRKVSTKIKDDFNYVPWGSLKGTIIDYL